MPDLERLLAQVPSLRSASLISPLHLPHMSAISRAVGRREQRDARRGDAVRRQAQLLPQESRLRLRQPHDQDQLEGCSTTMIEFCLVVYGFRAPLHVRRRVFLSASSEGKALPRRVTHRHTVLTPRRV